MNESAGNKPPKIEISAQMPKEYKKLDSIEIVRGVDGSERFYGKIVFGPNDTHTLRTPIRKSEFDKMWLEDSVEDQPVVEAIWYSSDKGKQLVTITGVSGRDDNNVYYKTAEGYDAVPHSEIKLVSKEVVNSSEIEVLRNQVAQLSEQVQLMQRVIEENTVLRQEVQNLKARLGESEPELKPLFKNNDTVQIQETDGAVGTGWQVVSVDEDVVIVEKDGQRRTYNQDELLSWQSLTTTAEPLPPQSPESDTDEPVVEEETVVTSPEERPGLFRRLWRGPNDYIGRTWTRRISTETEDNRRGIAPVVLGSMAVGAVIGAVVWELLEHKSGNGSSGVASQFAQIHADDTHLDKVQHATEMKAIAGQTNQELLHHNAQIHLEQADHAAEMKAIAKIDHVDKLRHQEEMNALRNIRAKLVHDHNSDLTAINGVLKQVGRTRELVVDTHMGALAHQGSDVSGYQYPWDWANHVHRTNPEGYLHTLAARAADDGHHVRWIEAGRLSNGNLKEILEVDGTTNTGRVIQIISKYK